MKTSEIREYSFKDLKDKIQQAEDDYNRLRINHSISPLENNQKITYSRKDIARMKTILTEKQKEVKN